MISPITLNRNDRRVAFTRMLRLGLSPLGNHRVGDQIGRLGELLGIVVRVPVAQRNAAAKYSFDGFAGKVVAQVQFFHLAKLRRRRPTVNRPCHLHTFEIARFDKRGYGIFLRRRGSSPHSTGTDRGIQSNVYPGVMKDEQDLPGFVVIDARPNGPEPLGFHHFQAVPRVGECIEFVDEEGTAHAYRVTMIIHAPGAQSGAGDMWVEHVGTLLDFNAKLLPAR